jgi:hypothetical protein
MDSKLKDLLTDSQLAIMASNVANATSEHPSRPFDRYVRVRRELLSDVLVDFRSTIGGFRCNHTVWFCLTPLPCNLARDHIGDHAYFEYSDPFVVLYLVWDDSLVTHRRPYVAIAAPAGLPILQGPPISGYGNVSFPTTMVIGGVTYTSGISIYTYSRR